MFLPPSILPTHGRWVARLGRAVPAEAIVGVLAAGVLEPAVAVGVGLVPRPVTLSPGTPMH